MMKIVVEAKKLVPDVEPNAVGTDVSDFYPDYGEAAVMLKPVTPSVLHDTLAQVLKVPERKLAALEAEVTTLRATVQFLCKELGLSPSSQQ